VPLTAEERANQILDVEFLPKVHRVSLEIGGIYYTRVGMWFDDGYYSTTNYRVGTFVPVNTKVRLGVTFNSQSPRIMTSNFRIKRLDTGELVRVHNKKRYSGVNLMEFVFRTFSKEPLSLHLLEEDTRERILSGRLSEGMTRYQVILARGYPPVHHTPDLRGNVWEYWSNRYNHRPIQFVEGRLLSPVVYP
jgi:hypothetical protein